MITPKPTFHEITPEVKKVEMPPPKVKSAEQTADIKEFDELDKAETATQACPVSYQKMVTPPRETRQARKQKQSVLPTSKPIRKTTTAEYWASMVKKFPKEMRQLAKHREGVKKIRKDTPEMVIRPWDWMRVNKVWMEPESDTYDDIEE